MDSKGNWVDPNIGYTGYQRTHKTREKNPSNIKPIISAYDHPKMVVEFSSMTELMVDVSTQSFRPIPIIEFMITPNSRWSVCIPCVLRKINSMKVPSTSRYLHMIWLVVDLPLWKMMELKSVGMMTFPTEWKVIKFRGSKPPTSIPLFPPWWFHITHSR